MGRLASVLETLLPIHHKPSPSSLFSEGPAALADERPDAGSYEYWQQRAQTYDEDIYKSSEEDQGLIRGEIEAAAQRARGHGVLSRVCDTPGHGECAATGHHQDVPEGFIPGQNLLAIDAGCGPGLWLRGLSSRFSHVIGLDQSQNLLEKAENQSELLHDQQHKVELRPAVDLGKPCVKEHGAHGEEFCGPEVPGTRQKADLVASFNVLISPNKESRENILHREADMLRPAPTSTLLLLVPSAESFRAVRNLYQQQGGPESGLGRYDDYSTKHAAEEANNVFRVYARTKHYTKQEACEMVEKVGLSCDKVMSYPLRWRYVFPFASDQALSELERSHQPQAHEWIVVAHPKAEPLLSRVHADFL